MVFTVCMKVLLGIILLSCIQSVVNENVDINTLYRIQTFFRQSYASSTGQYAVAINVPKVQCQSGFYPSESNFLLNDKSATVRPNINRDSMYVYRGTELIAAGHHKDAHSEDLLMNPPNNSPLTDLMNRNNDGCVVFYTLNSPCINRCLNDRVNNNIIPGLDKLKAYRGIKAFVYTFIYNIDQSKIILREELQKIADRVPLYRCKHQCCILCGEPGSNIQMDDRCLEN